MGNNFNGLEKVIIDHKGIHEHEDGFRNAQCISCRSLRFRLEVLDTIVCNITDCSSSKCRDLWDLHILMDCQFLLQHDGGISFNLFVGTGLDHFQGV